MKNIVLMLLISIGLTSAARAGAEPTTCTYNERFGFSITYKTINLSQKYFAVSGYRDSNVFYVKSYVIDGVIKTLSIWYDAKLKSTYDRETVAISLYGFNPRLPSDP